jgi:hypothetical protein
MNANQSMMSRATWLAALALMLGSFSMSSHAAATIVIQNGNAAGVGFNDPTPAAPVGGNTGATLGQQRLNAFQAAANKWGATLTSVTPIIVFATFEPLTCTPTSAVLGSAGAITVFRDFAGANFPGTWYSVSLANKLFGADLDPTTPDIRARFNSNLGTAGCLTGVSFYLGLDNNHGTDIDLVTVLTHEFAHGLGFQTFTSGLTGAQLVGFPSVYDHFLLDTTSSLFWTQMTDAQRQASALNSGKLVWTGANVTSGVPQVLAPGVPLMTVSAPASVAGLYQVGTAAFGPLLTSPGVTGEIMPVMDTSSAGNACTAFTTANALAVNGKLALMDRGVCGFAIKVKNAQNAGAIGAIIGDNVPGSPPAALGGADPTITIPAVRITLADANTLKSALRFRSRTHSDVFATLGVDLSALAGADAAGHAQMFTPNPFQSGSSVSHWDTIAFPNLLMEPSINADLTHEVIPPNDLTFPLLIDEGW